MKVLLIDQFSELGGAQRGMIDAALGIVERGGEVHAVVPEGPAFDRLSGIAKEISAILCGPLHSVRKTARDAIRFAAQLPSQVAVIAKMRRDVDLVYVHGPRVAPAAALARGSRPLVYHAHSIVQQESAAKLLGRALRPCTALFAVSGFVARWLGTVTPKPARVIYNGVRALPAAGRTASDSIRIGILGRMAPEKGQLEFVRAAKIAVGRDPRLRFIALGGAMFAGDSYFQRVRAESGPEVTFLPWSEDIASFFANLDLLVVPSSPADAGPRVILEAFAAGVPVLATNWGGNPELVEQGKTGLLVDSVEPAPLAQAIAEAVQDPARLHSMSTQALAAWQNRFSLDRYRSEVCDALEGVLRSRQRPASAGANARA